MRHHCGFQVRPGGPRRPRRPQDGPKTAPRRPKTPTRRAEDVFFCARVPENLIKPIVFYTFLQCVTTPPRRTGDASRQLQDAFRTPPKKKSAVLGASWGVLGCLGASWSRLGGVLKSILDPKISVLGASFFWGRFWGHFGPYFGPFWGRFWVQFSTIFKLSGAPPTCLTKVIC